MDENQPCNGRLSSINHRESPGTRQNLKKFSDQLNAAGFATLVYDKRGSGQSTGSWTSASFDENVSDAQAGIASLLKDSRIDARRVGVWGVSQAGWFIPALAERTPNLAFAIVLTGGGSTPTTEIIAAVLPHVLVKGTDWAPDKIVGRDTVEAHGGTVILMPVEQGWSTTSTVEKIRRT